MVYRLIRTTYQSVHHQHGYGSNIEWTLYVKLKVKSHGGLTMLIPKIEIQVHKRFMLSLDQPTVIILFTN